VEEAWREDSKAVLVASPANPTGTLLSPSELRELHAVVRRRGGALIVDEIYQGLVYDASGGTALEIADDIFVINSFSKFFGMTGWRLGWLVAPESFVAPIDRLAQNIFLSAPTLSQHAALSAFSPQVMDILEARRVGFQQRRDFLLPELRSMGFEIPLTPQGAFYLYAGCRGITDDSYQFAQTLLEEAGVAVTPGRDFGFHQPETHLRFAYTTDLSKLEEGVDRLRCFIQ
jgi:aspartate/methionine/tyrosine aminotransferase